MSIQDGKVFELQVSVYIHSNMGDQLNVSETVTIPTQSFLDIAKVLGQFHDLAQSLKLKGSQPAYDPQRPR